MTPEKLKDFTLSPDFGFKIKAKGEDLCFFRYDANVIAWRELVTGQVYRDTAAVKAILTYEMQRGDFIVFQCCCFDCFTAEAKRIGLDFMRRTGEQISNGYWPDHVRKMEEIYQREISNASELSHGGEVPPQAK